MAKPDRVHEFAEISDLIVRILKLKASSSISMLEARNSNDGLGKGFERDNQTSPSP